MLLALIGGAAGLAFVLRGAVPPPEYAATAPPLALGSGSPGLTASGAPAASVAMTTRLIVSAGGIDLPVVQGDGVTVPLHLAIHYPGTDQPGGGSNALYYAHDQPGMFNGLYRVHPGDLIEAVRADGTQVVYKVAALEMVAFNDRSVLAPSPYDEITLLTCTSYDPYTPRYIVIGLRT